MSEESNGFYLTTFSGKRLYFDDPKDFDIEDIATGLSNVCRWAGQLPEHWSVAQHSLVLADSMDYQPLRKAALLHDAAEAYIGDFTRPLLHYLGGNIICLKSRIEEAIARQFGFDELSDALKYWDDQMIHIESLAFNINKDPRMQVACDLSEQQKLNCVLMINKMRGYTARTVKQIYLDELRKEIL